MKVYRKRVEQENNLESFETLRLKSVEWNCTRHVMYANAYIRIFTIMVAP